VVEIKPMTHPDSILAIHTSWGVIYIALSDKKVAACDLPIVQNTVGLKKFSIGKIDTKRVAPSDSKAAQAAAAFVTATLEGRAATCPPLLFPAGTTMQETVWRYLHAMKRGQVVTYGELARGIGRPRAARAIGQACGANPIPLFIPCHRVLAASGGIGGFSGGLAWKEMLLDLEAIPLPTGRKS